MAASRIAPCASHRHAVAERLSTKKAVSESGFSADLNHLLLDAKAYK